MGLCSSGASGNVGFDLVRVIAFWLAPRLVVLFVFLSLLVFVCLGQAALCPHPCAGWACSAGCPCRLSLFLSLFLFCLLVSLSAVKFLVRSFVSLSPSLLLSFLCVCFGAPCKSPTFDFTFPDRVQLSPPVDLCVRELSPPLSNVIRGL